MYIEGKETITLHGNYDELSAAFRKPVDAYIQTRYSPRVTASSAQR